MIKEKQPRIACKISGSVKNMIRVKLYDLK